MKRNHKHADMIRRWLDDNSLEVEWKKGDTWSLLSPNTITWDEECDYRFKSKMIKVGEYSFPEPMRVAPAIGTTYWAVQIDGTAAITEEWTWACDDQDRRALNRGLCHATKEAAEQHAKALIALTEIKE